MAEELVGKIVKFFSRPSVAAIEVTDGSFQTGDTLWYKGHTTDYKEEVKSMEIDNQQVVKVKAGDLVGIKVKERVRENDRVYKLVE